MTHIRDSRKHLQLEDCHVTELLLLLSTSFTHCSGTVKLRDQTHSLFHYLHISQTHFQWCLYITPSHLTNLCADKLVQLQPDSFV